MRFRTTILRSPGLALLLLAAVLGMPASTSALTIDVSFTASTYVTTVGDDHASLLLQHATGPSLGAASVTALEGVSTSVYAGGETQDYSLHMTSTFTVALAGNYTFQVGTDWGRGGAAALSDDDAGSLLAELVRTDDLWWANSFSNPDVFTISGFLDAGTTYTLSLVGFEGCCGGASSVRFSYEGGGFLGFNVPNLQPFVVPEPAAAALLAAAAACAGAFAVRVRRSRPGR